MNDKITNGGNTMTFFIISLAALFVATFFYIRQEHGFSKKVGAELSGKLKSAEDKYEVLKRMNEAKTKEIEDLKNTLNQLSKKLEWVELKLSVPQKAISPLKLEPITVNLVYPPPTKVDAVKKLSDKAIKEKVIKSIKGNMKSIRQ